MLPIVFYSTLALDVFINGMLLYSIARPNHRVWPPPGPKTWQYSLVWLLIILLFGGLILVGICDWNSFGWPSSFRWSIGLFLIVMGNVLAWFGVRQLSLKTTSGIAGPLVTDGLYRYSRNPQYIGDITIIAGWAVLSASGWTLPLCLGGILVFALTPIAEEPWLEELHGDAYRDYCQSVPRFLPSPFHRFSSNT